MRLSPPITKVGSPCVLHLGTVSGEGSQDTDQVQKTRNSTTDTNSRGIMACLGLSGPGLSTVDPARQVLLMMLATNASVDLGRLGDQNAVITVARSVITT